jgi:hypothetical protein
MTQHKLFGIIADWLSEFENVVTVKIVGDELLINFIYSGNQLLVQRKSDLLKYSLKYPNKSDFDSLGIEYVDNQWVIQSASLLGDPSLFTKRFLLATLF